MIGGFLYLKGGRRNIFEKSEIHFAKIKKISQLVSEGTNLTNLENRMRYYVISDVHGYYTQMKSALEKAGFFSDTTPHKLIMLGDLFDRGHEAKQLQQFILEQMEQDKIILIRGNHEDLFVELVTTDAGMPFIQYLNDYRLTRAGEYLKMTEENVTQIALKCGFENLSYFNRLK